MMSLCNQNKVLRIQLYNSYNKKLSHFLHIIGFHVNLSCDHMKSFQSYAFLRYLLTCKKLKYNYILSTDIKSQCFNVNYIHSMIKQLIQPSLSMVLQEVTSYSQSIKD